jgi:hypothetical protein
MSQGEKEKGEAEKKKSAAPTASAFMGFWQIVIFVFRIGR